MARSVIWIFILLAALVSSASAPDSIVRRQKPLTSFKNGGFEASNPFQYWKTGGTKGSQLVRVSPGYNGSRSAAGIIVAPAASDGSPSSFTMWQIFPGPFKYPIWIWWWWGPWCLVYCYYPYPRWWWTPCWGPFWPFLPWWEIRLNGKMIYNGTAPSSSAIDATSYQKFAVQGVTSSAGKNNLSITVMNYDPEQYVGLAFDSFQIQSAP